MWSWFSCSRYPRQMAIACCSQRATTYQQVLMSQEAQHLLLAVSKVRMHSSILSLWNVITRWSGGCVMERRMARDGKARSTVQIAGTEKRLYKCTAPHTIVVSTSSLGLWGPVGRAHQVCLDGTIPFVGQATRYVRMPASMPCAEYTFEAFGVALSSVLICRLCRWLKYLGGLDLVASCFGKLLREALHA